MSNAPPSTDETSVTIFMGPADRPSPVLQRVLGSPWIILWLAFAVALVWGQSLGFAFVWDDHDFIENLPAIRSFHNLPRFFYDINAQAADGPYFRVFRPVRNVVYTALCLAGGGRPVPWMFHLTNLLGHFGVCVFLYYAVCNLMRSIWPDATSGSVRIGAAFAALGFAVHPLNSEVVCWAKALDDILAALFALAAWNSLLLWPRLRSGYVWALVFFALAVYSKVSAAPFFLFVPFLLEHVHHCPRRENVLRTGAFAAVAAIYLFHRAGVLGQMEQISPLSGTYLRTLLDTVAYAAPRYARLLLGIPPFCIDYAFLKPGGGLGSGGLIPGLILLLAGAGGIVILLRRKSGGAVGAAAGLVWAGLFFLPVSNLVPMMQYLAERFCYLPLLGLMVAAGFAVTALAVFRPRLLPLVGLVLTVWAAVAAYRASIWKDDVVLFVMSSHQCTPSARVIANAIRATYRLPFMAAAFCSDVPRDKVNWEMVRTALDSLNALYPGHPEVELGYAMSAWRRGDVDAAWKILRRALRKAPGQVHLLLAMARIELIRKQYGAAGKHLLTALHMAPGSRDVYKVLAQYYRMVGEARNAERLERKCRGCSRGVRRKK